MDFDRELDSVNIIGGIVIKSYVWLHVKPFLIEIKGKVIIETK